MGDHVVESLRQLSDALRRSGERIEQAIDRAERLAAQRDAGRTWGEIVREEERPTIIDLIGENLDELYVSGGLLRRTLARALHEEGLSMEQIARLFGVTRQRVSGLLRGSAAPEVVESGERL
ncbi:MAG TPA: helix-turn-helix domain-containing protein [Acidimicrobiales bacterium]|jgi:predicted XRE-type DNA-binding protein|nr:helix-turn-helix domain-containing protein [Acidimicrobiales bacterium]